MYFANEENSLPRKDKFILSDIVTKYNNKLSITDSIPNNAISMDDFTLPYTTSYIFNNMSIEEALSYIFQQAINNNITDIYVSVSQNQLHILYKKHNRCFTKEIYHHLSFVQFKNILKSTAGLDIIENQKPQSGSAQLMCPNHQSVSIRVSTHPTITDELITIRILYTVSTTKNMFCDVDTMTLIINSIKNKTGLCLISGATGTGKTTLLYSILTTLSKYKTTIMTIEDPVEMLLPNIYQTDINKCNISLEEAIKSILRHNPDVLAFGEIRDLLGLIAATKMSMTGTLVLASIHANNITSVYDRLAALGGNMQLIAQYLLFIIHCDNAGIKIYPKHELLFLNLTLQPTIS